MIIFLKIYQFFKKIYLTYKPNYLFQFNPDKEIRTFPTPRSWSFLSKIIEKPECRENLIYFASGLVGYQIATEFVAFFKLYDQIPKIEPILEGKSEEVPKNLSVLYLLICGILNFYQRLKNKNNYQDNLISYIKKLPIEFGVLMARDLVQIDNSVILNKVFIEWINNNKNAFLTPK